MELEALSLLVDIAIIMLAALFFGLLAHKVLGQPAILGYLFAGISIGPFTSGVISDGKLEEIETLANLGVSLLLFAVGLEFSSKRVGRIWKVSAIAGTFEMLFMFVIGSTAGLAMGWSFTEASFLGACLMISSTIIIIKVLGETGQMESLHGRLLVGRLVIEDIGAIVVIALVTGIWGLSTLGLTGPIPVIIGVVFLANILYFGKKSFPHLIERVSKSRSKELFLLTIFGICIGTAVVSDFFGLSLALGAFIAGMVLSESEHNLDIINQTRPLKDIFLIIFFVSVGMTIDPMSLIANPVPIVIVIAVLMMGKSFANSLGTKLLGYHPKTSTTVGLSMMQIGEFSFIIASMGYGAGIISVDVYSAVIGTSLITMVLTPYAMKSAPGFYEWFSKRTGKSLPDTDEDERLKSHVRQPDILILGYAEVVRDTVKCFQMTGKNFLIIDYNPKKVHEMTIEGIPHIFGDASNEHILEMAGVSGVRLIVVALSDMMDADTAIQLCHKFNKDAYVIARAYNDRDRDMLLDYADDIIISEDVAGRRLAWHCLQNLGFEEEAIRKDIEIVDPEAIGDDF